MEYLRKSDITLINRKTVEIHGGKFIEPENLLNEEPLEYLIEAVSSSMYDEELYPLIHDKAGLYMFNTISNHIFQDGNKRTGLESALLFLRLNNFTLNKSLVKVISESGRQIPKSGNTSLEILLEFTLTIARAEIGLTDCQLWFSKNISEIK